MNFSQRHIGPTPAEQQRMLATVGFGSLSELASAALPPQIAADGQLSLPPPLSETDAQAELRRLGRMNEVLTSMIGLGYYGTLTPAVIRRNLLENPGWYTAYTPYQPEISQGRLEALLNFQTMVADLTGLEVANASLLDEATAAAEAMAMAHAVGKSGSDVLAVATDVHPQTRAVLATRAKPIGITIVDVPPGDFSAIAAARPFALVLQYPGTTGALRALSPEIDAAHDADALAIVAADLDRKSVV